MSLLSKLFGGNASKPEPETVTHEGFTIIPEPIREGTNYRIAARIEKVVDGETKSHHLIRADTLGDLEMAKEASVGKAKQMIDEQGERIFG